MDLLYKAQTRFLFHAHVKLKLPLFCADSCFDHLFSLMEEVDRCYNSYRAGSYVDQINRHAGCFVEVDDVTVSLLRRVMRWSDFFHGAFDITIMPLIRLWGFYKEEVCHIPDSDAVEATKRRIDYRRIEIDGNRVRIGQGQEIITGSFLKAYAVDRLMAELGEMGIEDAVINAGGSTICAVNDELHPAWTVNVREPAGNGLLYKLRLSNKCYTTSSQRETYVTIDGRKYGHILNPLTGFPSANRMVGIVTDNCMDGDILSTGLFLLGLEAFIPTMARLQEQMAIEGFLMDGDGQIVHTREFPVYLA